MIQDYIFTTVMIISVVVFFVIIVIRGMRNNEKDN